MAQMDVGAAIDEICDPNIVMNRHTLGDFLERISDAYFEHRAELAAILPSKDISPFLNALKGNTPSEHVSAACEIFKWLFSIMTPHHILSKYAKNLADGLAENAPFQVQNAVLTQLLRIAKDNRGIVELTENEELLGLVIDRLDNCLVAGGAQDIILRIVSQLPNGYNILFNERLAPKFQVVQNKDTICRLRAYEVYCRIAVNSPETAGRLTPQLEQLVASFRQVHKDVLVQLNYVELLTVLVASKHTIQFIVESGVVPDMKKLLVDTTNKRAVFLEPGVCEFFGRFGENHPRLLCEEYTDILKFMIELTKNIQFQALAISNLGLMARTAEGKRCLNEKLKLEMVVLMQSIGDLLEGHDLSFKKEAALAALSHLLEVEDTEQDDLMLITQSWFTAMCERPMKAVWDCAKHHNEEVRTVAFGAFRSIALLSWGRDALLEDCAGFFEWVLNRDRLATKAEMDAKFSIVAALVEDANKIKCPEKRAALRAHFSEGPYIAGVDLRVSSEYIF